MIYMRVRNVEPYRMPGPRSFGGLLDGSGCKKLEIEWFCCLQSSNSEATRVNVPGICAHRAPSSPEIHA